MGFPPKVLEPLNGDPGQALSLKHGDRLIIENNPVQGTRRLASKYFHVIEARYYYFKINLKIMFSSSFSGLKVTGYFNVIVCFNVTVCLNVTGCLD